MTNSVISMMVYLISPPFFISVARYCAAFSLTFSNVSAFFMPTTSNVVPESSRILPMNSLDASLIWVALDITPVALFFVAFDGTFLA